MTLWQTWARLHQCWLTLVMIRMGTLLTMVSNLFWWIFGFTIVCRQTWQICCGQHQRHKSPWSGLGRDWWDQSKIWVWGTKHSLSAERVKSLSKKDTAPRGRKDEIKDFDQWSKEEQTTSGPFFQRRTIILSLVNQCLAFLDRNEVIELYYTLWWMVKLQICGIQVFRVGLTKASDPSLVLLHNDQGTWYQLGVRKNLYLPVETIYLYISIYLAVASNRVFKVIKFQHRAFKEQKEKEKNSKCQKFTLLLVFL